MAGSGFIGSFAPQEPILEVKSTGAFALMPSGRRLRRYETGPVEVTAALGRSYVTCPGLGYCLLLASGGQVLQLLRVTAAPLAEFLLAVTDWPDLVGAA